MSDVRTWDVTILLLIVLVVSSVLAAGADKRLILPPGAKPGGNYSQGILADGTLYISRQGGEDASGRIPTDFDAEVKQSLDNLGAVLNAAAMSPADVVSVQVYLSDAANFQRMNAAYARYFKDPPPTRTTVLMARLTGAGNVEFTVTARK